MKNPNLNIINATRDIYNAIEHNLQGEARITNIPDNLVEDFVNRLSDAIDLAVFKRKEDNPKIIQNAVYHKKDQKFYNSRHVHDFVGFELDGKPAFIDGGTEYIRRSFMNHPDLENYNLYENSSDEEISEKLLWGTYGKNGDEPLSWVVLSKCSCEHLEKILQQNYNPLVLKVVRKTLNERKELV